MTEVINQLKVWPEFFAALMTGEKNFELRKNDRDFQVGNILLLQEYDPQRKEYTGEQLHRRVAYMLEGPMFGLEAGFVILGLESGQQTAAARVAELEATINGIVYVLKLDTGKGIVNQCEHLRDAIDELRAERDALAARIRAVEELDALETPMPCGHLTQYRFEDELGEDCAMCLLAKEHTRARDMQAERDALAARVAELEPHAYVWAGADPFTGAQVLNLLNENERLTARLRVTITDYMILAENFHDLRLHQYDFDKCPSGACSKARQHRAALAPAPEAGREGLKTNDE